MKFTATIHFSEVPYEAGRQASLAFEDALSAAAEVAPAFERVSRVYILLALRVLHPSAQKKQRGSFRQADGTYYMWSDVDLMAFAASGWASRIGALADATRDAVSRIARTRISEAERAFLLESVAKAETRALNAEPSQIEPINEADLLRLTHSSQVSSPEPSRLVRLYKSIDGVRHYREMWFDGAQTTEHEGVVGEIGKIKETPVTAEADGFRALKEFEQSARKDGFRPVSLSKQVRLIVEYASESLPDDWDVLAVEKLHNVLDQILGWTGLGYCDGGSSGSGTAELCCFVVDFKLGKEILERELPKAGWTQPFRIYREA